jgi:hypothetical protein
MVITSTTLRRDGQPRAWRMWGYHHLKRRLAALRIGTADEGLEKSLTCFSIQGWWHAIVSSLHKKEHGFVVEKK